MKIEIEQRDKATVLVLHGRLDANTASDLERVLASTINGDSRAIALDLDAIAYISSAGLRVLLTAAKELLRQQRVFIICNANADIMNVFRMTGFDRILRMTDCLDKTLDALP